MIPIRDNIRSRTFPVVNWLIIGLNLLVFIYEISLSGTQLESFINQYGLIPSRLSPVIHGNFSVLKPAVLITLLSTMFIHGSFLHVIGNMWFLFVFGDNVEDRMGKINYLMFYLVAGIMAGVTHVALNLNSDIPAIGASGAISGVMAAYMFLFPRSRVVTLIPVFYILPLFVPIRAFVFIGIWFILQLLYGTSVLVLKGEATGIAFWAHIGGFVAGILLFRLFVRK